MKRLIEIIQRLKPSEVQFIKEKIDGGGRVSKKYKLFKLLMEEKYTTDKEAAYVIYKKKPDSAFSQLKKRLKGDILNLLIIAPPSANLYDSSFENEIQCQKLILQGKLLLEKGIRDEALEILKKAYIIATNFELHDLRLSLSKIFYEESFYSNNCEKILKNSEESFLEAFDELKFSHAQIKRCLEGYSPFCSEIEDKEDQDLGKAGLKHGNSSRETFWFKYAVLRELVEEGEYQKAKEIGKHLQGFIAEKDPLNNKKFKGLICLEIGKAALLSHDFIEGERNAKESERLFENRFFLLEQAVDLLFRLKFFGKDFQDANKIAQRLLSLESVKNNKNLYQKWLFFLAYAYYKMELPDLALKVLNKLRINEKELVELGINVRILDLMIALENNDLDYFDCRLECFRKQLYQGKFPAKDKMKEIYSFLKELSKYNFDFERTLICSDGIFDILNNICENSDWSALSFDLFPFHEYVGTKFNYDKEKLKSHFS